MIEAGGIYPTRGGLNAIVLEPFIITYGTGRWVGWRGLLLDPTPLRMTWEANGRYSPAMLHELDILPD